MQLEGLKDSRLFPQYLEGSKVLWMAFLKSHADFGIIISLRAHKMLANQALYEKVSFGKTLLFAEYHINRRKNFPLYLSREFQFNPIGLIDLATEQKILNQYVKSNKNFKSVSFMHYSFRQGWSYTDYSTTGIHLEHHHYEENKALTKLGFFHLFFPNEKNFFVRMNLSAGLMSDSQRAKSTSPLGATVGLNIGYQWFSKKLQLTHSLTLLGIEYFRSKDQERIFPYIFNYEIGFMKNFS